MTSYYKPESHNPAVETNGFNIAVELWVIASFPCFQACPQPSLTSELALQNMPNDEPLYVDCGVHGRRVAAVVCCHMIKASHPVGFIENNSDPNDRQSWCERCEEMFVAEGDKTEAFEAFNDRAIVCCVCYERLKEKHSTYAPG